MQPAQAHILADGRRLHLHHGPIDLIIEATGPARDAAYTSATHRFETLLEELVAELPALRQPALKTRRFESSVARRMQRAVVPHLPEFVTPMAAVAGAVADEILNVMAQHENLTKIYVNNGGDAAFYLAEGQQISAAIAMGGARSIIIDYKDAERGVATSGWRGRSMSFGIADTVSVVASTAAVADVAATLIANAVDLPGHTQIVRTPACDVFPDNDLGARLITTAVGILSSKETGRALDKGERYAYSLCKRNIIAGAILILNEETRIVGRKSLITQTTTGELADA